MGDIDDSAGEAKRELLDALADGVEPTWLLVEEQALPGAQRERVEAELRALERLGLVYSSRELAADPSRPAGAEDDWWGLTGRGEDHIVE